LFTFTRRLLKPTGREINSTIDFSDPANYYKGNPALVPENINNLELGFNKTWQNISFTSGIYYNSVRHVIQHIQTDPVNNETTTIPENLQGKTTTGLELTGHFDLTRGWDVTANANIFERHNDAAPQFGIIANNGLSWNANITTNVTPLERLSFQIHANYRAPYMDVQDKNRAVFGLDAAAKYDFAGDKASLSLNANNVFNSRKGAFLRSSNTLLLDWERRTVSSRATLTLSYRFGAHSAASRHAGEKESEQEAD
jgi:outer membrane receptor protein involved in Fe transport